MLAAQESGHPAPDIRSQMPLIPFNEQMIKSAFYLIACYADAYGKRPVLAYDGWADTL